MAAPRSRAIFVLMVAPLVALLVSWVVVPLGMTLYVSFQRYTLLVPGEAGFVGMRNYAAFLANPAFATSLINTAVLIAMVLAITVVLGTLLALLLDQPIIGRRIVQGLIVAPFFVMPTASALIWQILLLNPEHGVIAPLVGSVDLFEEAPLIAIVLVVAWTWLPFATLVVLASLQSVDAAALDRAASAGAGPLARFRRIILPHLARPIALVILIQTIALMSVFAEILVTTGGGPGRASMNLVYLTYTQSFLQFDVGAGAAGGVIVVGLAGLVAIALMRMIVKVDDA